VTPSPSPAAGGGEEEEASVVDGDEGGGGQEARFQLGSLASQRRARPQGGGSGAEPTANAGQRKRSGAYDERMRRNKRYFLFGKTVPEWFFYLERRCPDGRTDVLTESLSYKKVK
jgi:hypothetical protein